MCITFDERNADSDGTVFLMIMFVVSKRPEVKAKAQKMAQALEFVQLPETEV